MTPEKIVNLQKHPIKDINYRKNCKAKLDLKGALVMENFLTFESLDYLQSESRELHHLAYFCHQNHNAYLLKPDPDLPDEHIRNLAQSSDKGCVTHDQIPLDSPLRTLYEWSVFQSFLEALLTMNSMSSFIKPVLNPFTLTEITLFPHSISLIASTANFLALSFSL